VIARIYRGRVAKATRPLPLRGIAICSRAWLWYNDIMIERKVAKHVMGGYDEIRENRQYWLSRSPEERVSAVEILWRETHGSSARLQRVASVVSLTLLYIWLFCS
jgi:hypothetical protein